MIRGFLERLNLLDQAIFYRGKAASVEFIVHVKKYFDMVVIDPTLGMQVSWGQNPIQRIDDNTPKMGPSWYLSVYQCIVFYFDSGIDGCDSCLQVPM